MFVCSFCDRSFTSKYNLKRHGDCRRTVQVCEVCGEIFKSEGARQRHQLEKHRAPKRHAGTSQTPMDKRVRLVSLDEPSTSNIKHCSICQQDVPGNRWTGHLRTLRHREQCCVVQEEGVELIKTSFKSRIVTYRLTSDQDPTNVKIYLQQLQQKFIKLVGDIVHKYEQLKVGVELFGRFLLPTSESVEVKSFNTRYQMVNGATDLEELFGQFTTILDRKHSEFMEKDSGWTLQQLLHLELGINKFRPLKPSSYLPLPKEIEAKCRKKD